MSFGFGVEVPAASLYDTASFPEAHGSECTKIKVMFFTASQPGVFVVCVRGGRLGESLQIFRGLWIYNNPSFIFLTIL